MKQPHSEDTIEHTGDEQDTGNHKTPGAADAGGADKFGGTRAGSQNVESTPAVADPTKPDADPETRHPVENALGDDVTGKLGPHAERSPERDEFGRL